MVSGVSMADLVVVVAMSVERRPAVMLLGYWRWGPCGGIAMALKVVSQLGVLLWGYGDDWHGVRTLR